MKIGMINDLPMLESLNYLFSDLEIILQKHQTFSRPPQYLHASKIRREEMTKELILNSDVVLGTMDEMFLATRERVGKHTPYIWFPFGSVTRGFPDLRNRVQYFKSTDVIVCHCEAELEITRKFFTNAQLRYVPFVYDDSIFYPLAESSRQAAKAALGFAPDAKILLYVGRISIEKNLHTLLRIFSIVQSIVPNVHLVIAGRTMDNPFMEFGVFPISMKNTLTRIYKRLGVPDEKVHFVGGKSPDELRALYNIADAVANLTLNHDENFGLAQVEAMGCGTPVVGTNWGGLKDTISDGESGYKVSTYASSALGIKVDWWEGLCRIVSLLTNKEAERQRLRRTSRDYVYKKFSFEPYCQAVEAVLADGMELKERHGEPLELSDFGREFFQECIPLMGPMPSYRRTLQTYQLYQQLITPYTGSSLDTNDAVQQPAPEQSLCLASPVVINEDGTVSMDDLISPFTIALPAAHRETILATLEAMKEEPLISAERLISVYLGAQPNVAEALLWMLEVGLILKTVAENNDITLQHVGMKMSMPLLSIQKANPMADALFFG